MRLCVCDCVGICVWLGLWAFCVYLCPMDVHICVLVRLVRCVVRGLPLLGCLCD